jgi:hypothetical protein
MRVYQVDHPAPLTHMPEPALAGPLVRNCEYAEYRAWCETNHRAVMWQKIAMHYKRLAADVGLEVTPQ